MAPKYSRASCGIYRARRCHSVKVQFVISSGQVEKFCRWMYTDATVYLKRKRAKYDLLLKHLSQIDNKFSYSKYNNISFDKSRNQWIASVRVSQRTIHLGRFSTEAEALVAQKEVMVKNNIKNDLSVKDSELVGFHANHSA